MVRNCRRMRTVRRSRSRSFRMSAVISPQRSDAKVLSSRKAFHRSGIRSTRASSRSRVSAGRSVARSSPAPRGARSSPNARSGGVVAARVALFTLNCAAIESAAVTIWLLAPHTRDGRTADVLPWPLATNVMSIVCSTRWVGFSSVNDHLDAIRKVAARRPSLDPNGIIGPPPGLKRVVTDAGATLENSSQAASCGITRH
jgi:hypothetical protein